MAEAPQSITINVKADSQFLRESISELLEQYSEWLDNEGLIVSVEDSNDERGHDDLVSDFFKERN